LAGYPALPCGLLACDADVSWAAAARAGVWAWLLDQDGQKMEKVLVIPSIVALVDQCGADAVRYYFLKGIEFSKDGDFSRNQVYQCS